MMKTLWTTPLPTVLVVRVAVHIDLRIAATDYGPGGLVDRALFEVADLQVGVLNLWIVALRLR